MDFDKAQEQDTARQQQIRNQKSVIERLQKQLEEERAKTWGLNLSLSILISKIPGEEIIVHKDELTAANGTQIRVHEDEHGHLHIRKVSTKA